MKPSEILKKGLELLETKGWTQGAFARGKDGQKVFSPEKATCFCGMGAVRVVSFQLLDVAFNGDCHAYHDAKYLLGKVSKFAYISWQDKPYRTFPEVKAKFIEAIKLAEAEEQAATL